MNKKENLTLQLVEFSPNWEDPVSNIRFLSILLKNNSQPDIIVLPEMFSTGFSMEPHKIAETMDGPSISWMKETSILQKSAICGSIAIKENEKYYNRFIFVAEGKIIAQYDKHHLFSYSGEDKVYTRGNKKITFEYLGWKICPMICFDLRFPVWNRNTEDYDLMINVASWPDTRIEAWDILLKARAMENVTYLCAVNRIGIDGLNLNYIGHSTLLSPIGIPLELIKRKEFLYEQVISASELKKWRNKYKFLEQRDPFTFTNL